MLPTLPSNVRIGVLRGGTSSEYALSLQTGGRILESLRDEYNVRDVFIDKDALWYTEGLPHAPHDLLKGFDVVINALHGGYGEDGKLQRFLDTHNVSYTGADALSAALSLKKPRSKQAFSQWNIKTPRHIIIEIKNPEEQAYQIFRSFAFPIIVKPLGGGSSHGVRAALTFPEIVAVFEEMRNEEAVLVEEYITGSPVTCGIIENYRGEKEYVLLPVEIRTGDAPLYEHDKRHEYEYICPTYFTHFIKKEIQESAKAAFKALGLRHYAQADFVVTRYGKVYLLEVNALPSLTVDAPFHHALEAVGIEFPYFIKHVAGLAVGKR